MMEYDVVFATDAEADANKGASSEDLIIAVDGVIRQLGGRIDRTVVKVGAASELDYSSKLNKVVDVVI
jgi:hypothetical protein